MISSSLPLTLGADLLKFVVFGGTSVLFGSDRTTLSSGSVGVSPGTTISGNYMLKDGSTESNTIAAKAAASELATAYNTGSTMSCQHSLSTGDLSGLAPMPGVYCSMSGVFSLSDMSTLVLDAHNVSGVTWIFQMSGNMSTGLASKVILKNGASASNVYWIVGGSTSIGAGSSMEGNILSPSTIRIGASASLDGRALSESIVIFEGPSTSHLPLISSSLPLTLGADLLKFVVFGGTSVLFGSDRTTLSSGSVGVSPSIRSLAIELIHVYY